jgi:CRISPR-associated protein Csb2
MSKHLCVTVRFLQPYFHGRADGGKPEWPPSPLRLFQSLVAASAARWRDPISSEAAASVLRWLEQQPPPLIVAPTALPADNKYRLYVPDNVGDKVAGSWSAGREGSIADYRVEKDVQPMRLGGEAVHYAVQITADDHLRLDVLKLAARSITHLGWGIDMVVGDATTLSDDELAALSGERWIPVDDLTKKNEAFLIRVGPDGFRPAPPLSVFGVNGYRRATDPSPRPFAAFALLKPDASCMQAFNPLRRTREVAGMLRNATATIAQGLGWPDERINVFVHGKTLDGAKPSNGAKSPDRFQYLPLPTINRALKRLESIRRMLITAPAHCAEQIASARRALAGAELINNEKEVAALLTILPGSDWVVRQYVEKSRTWSTVTPVILPGYDDPDHLRRKLKNCRDAETQKRYLARLDARIEDLLRKAFRQAGYSDELLEHAELDWRDGGFRAGVQLASRYLPPENLDNRPRYHVRVRFPHPIPGPVVIGSGRFRGFGLFAGTSE